MKPRPKSAIFAWSLANLAILSGETSPSPASSSMDLVKFKTQ